MPASVEVFALIVLFCFTLPRVCLGLLALALDDQPRLVPFLPDICTSTPDVGGVADWHVFLLSPFSLGFVTKKAVRMV